ncbi:proteasome subunit beta type-4-like [Zophobas morio]|uniref:proteasome subunit beta type-4-like n=1 Tax=Zophobas morio TaxID=2755281 RepID=UPI0030829383
MSCSSFKHTLEPTVTGTSVVGIKYTNGVMVAADCLGSYGSLARYQSISRIYKMNDQVVVAASGDYADFQYIKQTLEELQESNDSLQDKHKLTAKAVFSYLTRLMYNRRSNFNPLWNNFVVAGVDDNKISTLGAVDLLGLAFEDDTVGTGFGAYLALPLLREQYEKNPNMTEEEARKCLEDSLRILHYRDARSSNKIEIVKITPEGVTLSDPYTLETNWEIADLVSGYE